MLVYIQIALLLAWFVIPQAAVLPLWLILVPTIIIGVRLIVVSLFGGAVIAAAVSKE